MDEGDIVRHKLTGELFLVIRRWTTAEGEAMGVKDSKYNTNYFYDCIKLEPAIDAQFQNVSWGP